MANIANMDAAGGVVRGVRTIDHVPEGFNHRPPRYYLLWLMLPAILLLAAISLYPLVWLVYMTLHEVQLAPGKSDVWAGIDNFSRLATDKKFLQRLAHALQVQRALPLGGDRPRRAGRGHPQQQPFREDPRHHLPDADDDGARHRRLPLHVSL